MYNTRSSICAAILACLSITFAAGPTNSSDGTVLASDAEVQSWLAQRVTAVAGRKDGIGIVVGIIEPHGRRIIAYGHRNQGDSRLVDGDTVFEIGSFGKVFTALLLADMVSKGEVAFTDPVVKYLPAGRRIPERNGHLITLLDLATHTSGLPFMPDEVPIYSDRAAAIYGPAQLYGFLARYRLTRDPGTDWDYSNIDYWLLGQALTSRAGMDYASLLRTRVLAPLNMNSTGVFLTPSAIPVPIKARLATGHNAVLQTALSVSSTSVYAVMPAAGVAQFSTVNDLLTFLSVATGDEPSPLASSMRLMLTQHRPMGEGNEQAVGWVVLGKGDKQLLMHDGATWGYNSYVAWDPRTRIGVAVLSNQLTNIGDIALHLLHPNTPLEKPTVSRHHEISLAATVLDRYMGQYSAEDVGTFKIARDRDFLTLQLPIDWGLPIFRLRPESPTDFFVAELPVRVTFQTATDGQVNGVLVYPPRGQHGIPAKRIDSRN
jgi:serine-type D-Ala-D-Ala carboxypeptidase/endopeptidase